MYTTCKFILDIEYRLNIPRILPIIRAVGLDDDGTHVRPDCTSSAAVIKIIPVFPAACPLKSSLNRRVGGPVSDSPRPLHKIITVCIFKAVLTLKTA